MTIIELLFSLGIIVLLSGSIYYVLRAVHQSFKVFRNKLDILQTTRLIMARLRNELRNANDKPQVIPQGDNTYLNIPLSNSKTTVYYFDEANRRLYLGEKADLNAENPDPSEMRAFLFDDGQILKFEYDSSYRDASSFAESELTLNSKVWFKVTMKILYSKKFQALSDIEKQKVLDDPDDPRIKTFFMMITPRKVNWLLQGTQ